jgi:hypothetical protein
MTKTIPQKDPIKTAFDGLIGWSPQGCTITDKEATKFLEPLSNDDLVGLHMALGAWYNERVENVYSVEADDPDDVGVFVDEDAISTIEDLHDALKARSAVAWELSRREELAKRPKLRAV